MKITFVTVFCCISVFSMAQLSEKDSIITAVIYNDTLGSANEETEQWISSKLSGKTLQILVDENIISREDMRDMALPLGVFKNKEPINYSKGMIDLWKMKAARIKKNGKPSDAAILSVALMGIEASLQPNNQMNLRKYRDSLISPSVAKIEGLHKGIRKLYSDDRAVFMDFIADNLSPNVLLGFNIQELLPPKHMLEDGRIREINPIFKAYYFDRLVREAGTEFIHYYPARYDVINSYGPFQITNVAIEDINANNRLTNDFKKYKSMNDLQSLEDHIFLAALFAYNNWERLSILLHSDGNLSKFNDYFKDYKTVDDKKRKLRLFISGFTACMHHHPPNSWKAVRNYLKSTEKLDNIHYECVDKYGGKQLRKYYQSSVEAYLIMKVYHELFPD
jgi:hypothetical protein